MKGYRVINLENSIQGYSRSHGIDHHRSTRFDMRGGHPQHQPVSQSHMKPWHVDSAFPVTPVRAHRCVPRSILAEDFEVIDNTLLPISLSFLDSPCRDS
jgi:hypothetical protein